MHSTMSISITFFVGIQTNRIINWTVDLSYWALIVYIYHHHHHHVVPLAWIVPDPLSPLLPIVESSPWAGLQGYIPYPHIAAVCMFELVVLKKLDGNYTIMLRAIFNADCTSAEGVIPPQMNVLDIKLKNLVVRFPWSWSFRKCGVPLYCHRSRVHLGPA